MSSPSPGKRRMDTDVVKLYPLRNINSKPQEPKQTSCFVITVSSIMFVLFVSCVGSKGIVRWLVAK